MVVEWINNDNDVDGSNDNYHRRRTVLVTGGAGYIGSHTCVELLNYHVGEDTTTTTTTTTTDHHYGYDIVVIDNLVNSSEESIRRVKALIAAPKNMMNNRTSKKKNNDDNKECFGGGCLLGLFSQEKEDVRLHFRKCDIRDQESVENVLKEFPTISSCIHFAGLKAVGESIHSPLQYYHYNVDGTRNLLECLQKYGIQKFVFSSSATVYGDPKSLPIPETEPLQRATNPYGRTKSFIEDILRDLHVANPSWQIMILRYFNPIGAHPSGTMGEDPQGIPNNLMPYVAQVCVGRREQLQVFGNDYDTVDGTGVRDYIHVVDLAQGHVAALEKLYNTSEGDSGHCYTINLGTGNGISVLQLVKGMEEASGKTIPYKIVDRRPGDVATVYADPTFAKTLLGWEAKLTLQDMCRDTWNWQSKNPNGYK